MKYLLISLLAFANYAHSETLMFTCNVTGIDLKSFIIDVDSHKITYPEIFADALGPKENKIKFKLADLNDEYLHLERTYTGKKHGKSGTIKESIYILRYISYIGKNRAIRAKSMIYINGEHIAGNAGRCSVADKLF